MKINLYTIFDVKAGIYNKPFYMHNDSVVIRTMQDLLSDPNTDIAKHPEDFTISCLGTYEDTTATFDLLDNPRVIGKAIEILSSMNAIQTPKTSEIEDQAS